MLDFSGILFACAYAITAVFSLFLAVEERKRKARPISFVLLVLLGIVLWLFGLQEASGMLSGVTDMARQQARTDQWYAQRREFQWLVVGTIPLVGCVTLLTLLWLVRREWRRYVPVIFTLTYLTCLGAIQAVSLHQVDSLMRIRVMGLQVATWVDVIGLSLTVIALFRLVKMNRASSGSKPA